jgi:thioredoxin-like negative regulator of GroEL
MLFILSLNIDDVTENYNNLNTNFSMIFFFAPWNKKSTQLRPQFHAIADSLSDFIFVGEFDCGKNGKKCAELGVTMFPTLLLFKNGRQFKYTGDLDEESVNLFIMNPQDTHEAKKE